VSLPVITRDEAEADIAEAAIWYERRSAGLGAEFIRSLDACFALISRQPAVFQRSTVKLGWRFCRDFHTW
jgi:plasmid stabilization system protein ParE